MSLYADRNKGILSVFSEPDPDPDDWTWALGRVKLAGACGAPDEYLDDGVLCFTFSLR